MNSIAFDVSETITKYPKQCFILAEALFKQGWKIYILSPNEISTIHRDLNDAGFTAIDYEILNTGHKGETCLQKDITILLDDNVDYLNQIFKFNATTMPLQVLRK